METQEKKDYESIIKDYYNRQGKSKIACMDPIIAADRLLCERYYITQLVLELSCPPDNPMVHEFLKHVDKIAKVGDLLYLVTTDFDDPEINMEVYDTKNYNLWGVLKITNDQILFEVDKSVFHKPYSLDDPNLSGMTQLPSILKLMDMNLVKVKELGIAFDCSLSDYNSLQEVTQNYHYDLLIDGKLCNHKRNSLIERVKYIDVDENNKLKRECLDVLTVCNKDKTICLKGLESNFSTRQIIPTINLSSAGKYDEKAIFATFILTLSGKGIDKAIKHIQTKIAPENDAMNLLAGLALPSNLEQVFDLEGLRLFKLRNKRTGEIITINKL